MIRAPFITNPGTGDPFWYPYPFLNPNNANLEPISGYPGVILYVIGISVAMLAVGALVVWWGRRVGRRMPESETGPRRPASEGGVGTVETAGSPTVAP
jgi:hypothetical protein